VRATVIFGTVASARTSSALKRLHQSGQLNGGPEQAYTQEKYLAASPDVTKVVRDLVRVAAEAVGSNMGALYLLDKGRGVLKPAVVVNLPDDYIEGCGEVPLGQQCCGRAALHKMPWYVEDIWNDPVFPPITRDGARRAGVRAGFSVPVLSTDGECLGSLSAHFPEQHTPTQYELERNRLFAQLIAFALSRDADTKHAANYPIRPHGARAVGEDESPQSSSAA
jgi:GAF domain-containing protein